MQRIFNKLGFNAGAEDGAFGADMKDAVLLFEQFMGKAQTELTIKVYFMNKKKSTHYFPCGNNPHGFFV
ncbi:peptidoglycan-binding domain-containing protein [Bacillus salitolerans]|uniref:Peptidoglycan-binding domain-containing protein n=1 Tax=Bacillus salitolerans TaxID=1437434 RepID=A0ABW4LSH1_9BACI